MGLPVFDNASGPCMCRAYNHGLEVVGMQTFLAVGIFGQKVEVEDTS